MSYTKLRNTLAVVLATAFNMQEEELSKILPVDGESFDEGSFKTSFLEQDASKVAKGKEKFDQGYGKAKLEVMSNFEAELRDKYGVKEEVKGIELINSIINSNQKDSSLENISTHPEVLKILSEKETAFKKQLEDVKTEYTEKEQSFLKQRMFESVSSKALSVLDGLKPILSNDAAKASNQKKILLRELEGYDFQDNDGVITVLKDGKRLENPHGHGISFEELVKEKAESYFDFQASEQRTTPPGSGEGSGATKVPKNDAEYAAVISDRSISLEERMKIKEQYEAANNGNS